MSSKPSGSGGLPNSLPKDFFDSDKRSKKVQEDELANELEEFEREMAALEAESQQNIKEEFEKLQDDKTDEELALQMEQWKRLIALEKKAEELKSKTTSESAKKKVKMDHDKQSDQAPTYESEINLDDIEDFEDKLSDWRSKGL